MKVLNVNISLDPLTGGGTAERTFQMSRFLAKVGATCSVLTTDIGLTKERISTLNGVEVLAYPCISKRFYIPRFSFKEVRRLIQSVDVVHLMGHWTFLNALVYLIAHQSKKPYVLCPAGALRIYGRSKLIKKLYNRVVGEKIVRHAERLIAITADEIPQFRAYGGDERKVSVIPNGICPEDFAEADDAAFQRRHDLAKSPFILFVGRLNYIKGPDLLLHAFCRIKDTWPDYHLVFAGPDGGMLSQLNQIVAQSGAQGRVHFIDYLGGADKSRAYHASDLLVVPSRQEAMSIVALEAGITGTPVLLTDQCGFDEIGRIKGGRVVPASVNGLEKGLNEMLWNPPQLKSLGEKLREYTSKHHTWGAIVHRYLDLYDQILRVR